MLPTAPAMTLLPRAHSGWLRFPVLATAGLFAATTLLHGAGVTPSRATIEKHVDPAITVHGHYAAVRLPVTRGVPLWNPTAIKVAPDGTVFVSNYIGEILRLTDTDGDGLEDTAKLYADVRKDGLRFATSLALRGREVFVGTAQEIRVYEDADGDGVAERSKTFFRAFPSSSHAFDWVFGLTFDPAGRLNFSLSTDSYNPAPAPDPQGLRGALLRVQPDGTGMERIATGLRFPYGMAINEAGVLFFSDNKGGANLAEEINRVVPGSFYGHNPGKFPNHPPAVPPEVGVRFGYGLVGITFNPSTNDFGGTAGDLFVASWGPDFRWDRGAISRIHFERQPNGSSKAEEFQFAHEVPKLSDLAFGPQGDLYVAQFGREGNGHVPYDQPTGGIYRIIHAPWYSPPPGKPPYPVIAANATHGRQLFTQLSCAACHSVGEKRELLGPDLEGIGDMFSEEEILNAIRNPSDGIKSGHEAVEVELLDGETVLGRVLRADEESVVMLQAGNLERTIARTQVRTNRLLQTSLMPAGLIDPCSPADLDDLLAYLKVRRAVGWERWKAQAEVGFREWRSHSSRGQKALTGVGVLAVPVALVAGLWFLVRRRRAP
jgi:putative heme-binding domain-containing protein